MAANVHQFLFILMLFITNFTIIIQCLTCDHCETKSCKSTTELNCKGEVGKDLCGCCPKCLKVEGESCGGPWGVHGTCDQRYTCVKDNENDFNSRGKCIRANSSLLPPCKIWKFYYKLLKGMICEKRAQIFCNYSCSKCCINNNACNPDPRKYLTVKECQLISDRHVTPTTSKNKTGETKGKR